MRPVAARREAHERPAMPDPMTITSTSSSAVDLSTLVVWVREANGAKEWEVVDRSATRAT